MLLSPSATDFIGRPSMRSATVSDASSGCAQTDGGIVVITSAAATAQCRVPYVLGARQVIEIRGDEPSQFSVTSAPSGFSIDENTGLVSWSPTDTQRGAQTFQIKVTTKSGRSVTRTYSVDVQCTPSGCGAAPSNWFSPAATLILIISLSWRRRTRSHHS